MLIGGIPNPAPVSLPGACAAGRHAQRVSVAFETKQAPGLSAEGESR
jgi:hypothetical protein